MSLSATSATHDHSNIRSLIEESEKLVKDTLRTERKASVVRNALGASVCAFLFGALWGSDPAMRCLSKLAVA